MFTDGEVLSEEAGAGPIIQEKNDHPGSGVAVAGYVAGLIYGAKLNVEPPGGFTATVPPTVCVTPMVNAP